MVAQVLFLILIVYLGVYFMIVCHELGHYFGVRIWGYHPDLVKVGSLVLFSFRSGATTFEIGLLPYGVVELGKNEPPLSTLLFYLLGGPIAGTSFSGVLFFLAQLLGGAELIFISKLLLLGSLLYYLPFPSFDIGRVLILILMFMGLSARDAYTIIQLFAYAVIGFLFFTSEHWYVRLEEFFPDQVPTN